MIASPMDDCEVSGSIYLVAVPREVMPPVFYGNALLQCMRAVLFPKNMTPSEMADDVVNVPFEEFSSFIENQPAQIPPFRPIHGEILRDQDGYLYERTGSSIRRLGSLSSSRHGELFESAAALQNTTEALQPETGKSFRQFFSEPGESRVLSWGEFKNLVREQVARPERLRDNHRLACLVQVYENFLTRTPEAFARDCFGDIQVANQLFELTEALAQRLKIVALLPPAPFHAPRESSDGMIRAGDRILRLKLASDPTSDLQPKSQPVTETATTAPTSVTNSVACDPVKTIIPDRFLSPWENLLTREQVLSEMSGQDTGSVRLFRWIVSLLHKRELKIWRRQLWGKPPDEQLWGVRPPKGSLTMGEVADWSRATLAAAGYAPSMLREWEIFWRQKGL